MPEFHTDHFGNLEYPENSVLHFPNGLPGFEEEQSFLLVEQLGTKPLGFLQSLSRPDLCFIALPVLAIDPQYVLNMSIEDLQEIGLPPDRRPSIGADVLCMAIISAAPNQTPTANLLSPVVVNLATRVAMQVIQSDTAYSHQHPLFREQEEAKCS